MILSVTIIPNARQTEVVGWIGQSLKIRIAAPAIEGRANDALIRFLADQLDLAPSEIDIVSGYTSKQKKLQIPLTLEDVLAVFP